MREYELMKLLDKALFGYAQIRLLPGDKSEVQDMVIETANKKFCEMFDTDQDTLIGSKKSRLKGAIAEAADELMSQINTGAEDRLDYPFDIHVKDADKWLLMQVISIDDEVYNIFVMDKTKYIEASHHLQSHEELNKAIIEQSSEWTMLLGEDYQVRLSSPRGAQITGLSMEELSVFDPEAHIHPDDHEVFTSFLQDLKDNPAKLKHIKTRFINSENSYIWLEIVGSNFIGFPGLNGYVFQSRDITEHMEAQQKVNHQNEYIKSLLSAIPDLIAVIDKDGTVLDIRSGSNLRMHLDPEEVLGKNLNEIIGEPFSKAYINTVQKALKEGKTYKTQYEVNFEGINYHYGVRISPLGKDRVLALERDVSDLFESQMLVDKHTKFQSLIADISTAFVKADGDAIDQVLEMSLAKIGEFLGVHRAFIIDYNLDYSWTSLHSSWHTEGKIGMPASVVNTAITAKTWPHNFILNNEIVYIDDLRNLPDTLEKYMPGVDRKQKLSLIMIPVQSSDKVVATLCFQTMDTIREFPHDEINNLKLVANMLGEMINKQKINRRLKEQVELQEIINALALKYINLPVADLDDAVDVSLIKLAQYAEADQAMICTYDWDRNLLTATAEWFKDEGFAKKRKSSFRKIDEFPIVAEAHKKGEIFMFETAGDIEKDSIGVQSIAKYGVKSVILVPMMSGSDCIGFIGLNYTKAERAISTAIRQLLTLYAQLLVNVYKRKEMEESLVLEKEKAQKANRAKGTFLANMSHEIRTPLNGMVGFTELLINSELEDQQKRYAQNIAYSANSLLEIINDILDVSKIEAEKLELFPVRTDLIELVQRAADTTKVKATEKGLKLILDIPENFPRYAMIDPLRVYQILANLLSNAVKFTDKGEVEIAVNCAIEEDKDFCNIGFKVRDTGPGIRKDEHEKIFKEFSQLNGSESIKHGGTGLGLVIASSLAKLMNSRIELESTLGEGSVFSFSIPAKVERVQDDKPFELRQIKRALLVYENQESANKLKQMLAGWRVKSEVLNQSSAVIKHIKNHPPYDVILIDNESSGISGLEIIRELREVLPFSLASRPIILMIEPEKANHIAIEAHRLNIRYTITKPIAAPELLEFLKMLEDKSSDALIEAASSHFMDKYSAPKLGFKPKILIAEDNEISLNLLKEIFARQLPSADIFTAEDGKQALQSFKKHDPDIILMDVQMPVMDGISATKEIRKLSEVPIIAVSVDSFEEEKEMCFAAGMNSFIAKPVRSKELMEEILKHLVNLQEKREMDADSDEIFAHSELLSTLDQDSEALIDLIKLSEDSIGKKISELRQAINAGEKDLALAILHSLKGSASNMRYKELAEHIRRFEHDYKSLDKDQLEQRLKEAEEKWEKALNLALQVKQE